MEKYCQVYSSNTISPLSRIPIGNQVAPFPDDKVFSNKTYIELLSCL